uniref:Olfactory receptor 84 n=1 Tax=Aulacocentrum confusum TaxID=2767324 RepID=A0A7G8Z9A3_9HYME|nr:olfactory receptor 84 [Aulacocentrum confusum]
MNYSDSHEACQLARLFLRVLALLPWNFKSTILNRFCMINYRIIHIIILLWLILANTTHMVLRESNKNKKILLIGPISYAAMSFFKFCALYRRGKIIGQCMDHINDDWIRIKNKKYKELMRINMQWGKRATMACALLMYAGAISYNLIMPASVHIITNRDNDSTRMPIFPGYDFAFNCQNSPVYEIVFVTYFYVAFIGYTVTICSNHLAILSVSHIYGQLEILEEYMKNITNAVSLKNKKILHQKIVIIVNHHCRITE